MSLIPEFVEPQKSSAGKLSLVQYESGQQEGEGRAAKTQKKDIIPSYSSQVFFNVFMCSKTIIPKINFYYLQIF